MLIWLTGISGAGKSTIGQLLFEVLKPTHPKLIYLDGDAFRQALGDDVGYTLEDRDKNATRMTGMCKLLSDQGIDIICAANLTSQRFRDWCRKHIPGYYEVFIDVSIEVLAKRDPKGLYREALAGDRSHVVGVDMPFVPPQNPDLIIDNNQELASLEPLVKSIVNATGVSTK